MVKSFRNRNKSTKNKKQKRVQKSKRKNNLKKKNSRKNLKSFRGGTSEPTSILEALDNVPRTATEMASAKEVARQKDVNHLRQQEGKRQYAEFGFEDVEERQGSTRNNTSRSQANTPSGSSILEALDNVPRTATEMASAKEVARQKDVNHLRQQEGKRQYAEFGFEDVEERQGSTRNNTSRSKANTPRSSIESSPEAEDDSTRKLGPPMSLTAKVNVPQAMDETVPSVASAPEPPTNMRRRRRKNRDPTKVTTKRQQRSNKRRKAREAAAAQAAA